MNKLPSKVTADALDHILAQSTAEFNVLGGKLTHCMVTLPCGFIITGESSCVSPAEYDKELGEALSQKKAIAKLWELEAYLLSKDLYEQRERTNPYVDMVYEHSKILGNIDRLKAFAKQRKDTISSEAYELMGDQHMAMEEYASILDARMKLHEGDLL